MHAITKLDLKQRGYKVHQPIFKKLSSLGIKTPKNFDRIGKNF